MNNKMKLHISKKKIWKIKKCFNKQSNDLNKTENNNQNNKNKWK